MRRKKAQILHWSIEFLSSSETYFAGSLIGSQDYCLRMIFCGSWICPLSESSFHSHKKCLAVFLSKQLPPKGYRFATDLVGVNCIKQKP